METSEHFFFTKMSITWKNSLVKLVLMVYLEKIATYPNNLYPCIIAIISYPEKVQFNFAVLEPLSRSF